jgi:hypothetical protein
MRLLLVRADPRLSPRIEPPARPGRKTRSLEARGRDARGALIVPMRLGRIPSRLLLGLLVDQRKTLSWAR